MGLRPINYNFGGLTPAQQTLQGAAMGQGLVAQAEQRGFAAEEAQRQAELQPLRLQQAQLQLDQAQSQINAQREQAARANRAQVLMRELVSKGTGATFDDFAQFAVEFPEMSKETLNLYNALDENRKRPLVNTLAQSAAALKAGNIDAGIGVAEQFVEAAEAAGDAQLAQMGRAALDLAKIDPETAYVQIGTLLQQIEPELAKNVLGAADSEPAAVEALRIRAREAGLEPGSEEYRNFMLQGGAQKGFALEVDKDGNVRVTQGAVGGDVFGGKPPTEGQLAASGYLQRMRGAEDIFSRLEQAGTTTIPLAKSAAVDTPVEGLALTSEQQQLLQAQRDWVRATG